MKNLHAADLSSVVGGSHKRDELTQQLLTLQTSLKDMVKTRSGCNGNTMMLMIMAMAMRPGPSMVGVCAPGPSSIVNISARFRR